jgi:tRNA modification GTPase
VTETLATRLTPPGTGAIATIGLRGRRMLEIVRDLFKARSSGGGQLPESPQDNTVWLGRFGGETADEVVLAFRGPPALSGSEPTSWVEIHCHGGREVVNLLLETLAELGARVCDGPEFWAFVMPADRWRRAARERLLRAPTVRTAAILLHACYTHHRGSVEVLLSALDRGEIGVAEACLRAKLQYTNLGRHLIEPWKVVLAGAPNVGKSSLLNALAGYQRSIVAPTPGTTRDVVTTTVALDGWPVELADTAGLRQHAGAPESQGIERARGAAVSADLCLWVLDASAEPVWPDVPPERVLLVVNKADLAPAWDLTRAAGAVQVSARTGAGLPELCDAIVSRLVPHAPGPHETGTVPFTPELCDAVEEAYSHLTAGRIDEARRVLGGLLEPSGGPRP